MISLIITSMITKYFPYKNLQESQEISTAFSTSRSLSQRFASRRFSIYRATNQICFIDQTNLPNRSCSRYILRWRDRRRQSYGDSIRSQRGRRRISAAPWSQGDNDNIAHFCMILIITDWSRKWTTMFFQENERTIIIAVSSIKMLLRSKEYRRETRHHMLYSSFCLWLYWFCLPLAGHLILWYWQIWFNALNARY